MKIQILTQNIVDMAGLQEGITSAQNQLATVGVNVTIDYKETTFPFTSTILNSDVVYGGYQVNPQEIVNQSDAGHDITCLIYNWNTIFPHPTNPCVNVSPAWTDEPMQIPVNWYSNLGVTPSVTYPNVLSEFFLHEMSHYFAFKSGQQDLTHLLVNMNLNPSLYAQWSNKTPSEFYLFLIKGYLQHMPLQLSVSIKRSPSDAKETLGTMTAQNGSSSLTCRTLELPNKSNQQNVSDIPAGSYLCKYTFSWRMLKYTYEIQNVPNRTGIRIHSGNYFSDSLGCIILGDSVGDINKDGELDVLNSRATVASFESLMQKKDFVLTIA